LVGRLGRDPETRYTREGRIQSRQYQDRAGQPRTSFEIVATNFRMLGGKTDAAPEIEAPYVASNADIPSE